MFLLLLGSISSPIMSIGTSEESIGPSATATVELSDSLGASTPLGDVVLTGYAANYTATENMAAVERDILLPVESLPRDENFIPESYDSQYFIAWLESDETKWEPHSHLMNNAHALMWLKATEQGPIGPEPGSVLTASQQYGFLATHGSIASSAPSYLPDGDLTGEPFLELAGPMVTETQGVSNSGASDLGGVVVSGFMGFSGGDYSVNEMGEARIYQNFSLPEIAARAGDNFAYTWAWIPPPDTEVDVGFAMDFESRTATAHVNVTSGYFKQAREIPMPGGFIHRYWGVVFSLYLYFYPTHQGSDQGLTPRSRLIWPFETESTGELVAGGANWEEQWTDLSGGLAIELEGNKVVRIHEGGVPDSTDNEYNAKDENGEDGNHLTGAGVLSYNLTTDYLGQELVALTNITPFGSNESLVDAWGFSSLQIEGEDHPLTKDWLVDVSAHTGVWVFGVSIGWIWVSPIIQNGGDPAVKSDSWWWLYSPGGATAGLVFKVRDEVLVLAKIMIRPNEGFADIVIQAGAYTLDGEERDMKLWQHLDPSVEGNVVYADTPQDEEFGPMPTGTGGVSEHVQVTGDDGRRVRWTPEDEGGIFCIVDHDELVAHPAGDADGESITDVDIRFYTEHRNFGEEYYRAYAVYANTQFRISWGGDPPAYDVSMDLSDVPDEVEEEGTLKVRALVTNNGETPIAIYLWLSIDGNPAICTTRELVPGETMDVPLEFDLGQLAEDGMNTTHHWTNFTLKGDHTVRVEVFPLGAEDGNPDDNTVEFTVGVGESDDDGLFGVGAGSGWLILVLILIVLVVGLLIMWKRRTQDDEGDEGYIDDLMPYDEEWDDDEIG